MVLDNSTIDYEAVVLHDTIISFIAKAQMSENKGLDMVIESLKTDVLPQANCDNERNITSAIISFLETEKTFN